MRRKLCFGFLLAAVVALVVYSLWRNTPRQRAIRFLAKLSEVTNVDETVSELARKARIVKLLNLLVDPVVIEVQAASLKHSASHDEVSTAYLALMSESDRLYVGFKRIDVTESSSSHILVNAQLETECDFSDGRYSVNSPVVISLAEGNEGLKLSRVVDVSEKLKK